MQKLSSSNIVTEIFWTLALVIGTIIECCHYLWTEGLKLWTSYQTKICSLFWTTDDADGEKDELRNLSKKGDVNQFTEIL